MNQFTNETKQNIAAPLSAERPISTLAEDRLGRSGFASAVAQVISGWSARDSLVLAIYGPWGSGKSSVKNMVLDALHIQKSKTVSFEFNPWEWSGQEKVFQGFFNELAAALGSVDHSKEAAAAAKKVKMYATMLAAADSITGGVKTLITSFCGLLILFGLLPTQSPFTGAVIKLFGAFALLVLVGLSTSQKAGLTIAAYLSAKSEMKQKGIAELKVDLTETLGKLEKNVLVIVDDIDRLPPDGIRMMFQLVKANADFPNLVFLMLLQRDTVERALSVPGSNEEGAQFLEKIVQVGFDVPKLSPLKLEESVEMAISEIVERTPAKGIFDSERWGRIFTSAIRPYFRTLRDVKRFSNTLSFHFDLYKNTDRFDANPIDVIALEVLRQFEPGLYQDLFAAQALLTGSPQSAFAPGTSLDRPDAAETLFARGSRPQAKEILINVFPPLTWPMSARRGSAPPQGNFRAQWLKDLRPCQPEIFERYFRFSLSENDLSESEFAKVLESIGDQSALRNRLVLLGRKGLLASVISKLAAQPPVVSNESAAEFTAAIFDVERELFVQTANPGVASVPVNIQAVFLVDAVLRQLDSSSRFKILTKAINNTQGVFLPMVLLGTPNEPPPPNDPIVEPSDYGSLRAFCVAKIKSQSRDNLLEHPRLMYILSYWASWEGGADAREWMAGTLETPVSTLAVLRAFVQSIDTVEGNKVASRRYRFALQDFANYADPSKIAERVRKLAETFSDGRETYRLFLFAFDQYKSSGRYPAPQNLDQWMSLEDANNLST